MIGLGTRLKVKEPPFHRCPVFSSPPSPSQAVSRKVIAAAHTAAGMPPAANKLPARI
jgi:hypothetical protein